MPAQDDDRSAVELPGLEAFRRSVGTTFSAVEGGPPFTLESVRPLAATPGQPRAEPFALDLTRPGPRVGQGTVALDHPTFGRLDIFLVPVGDEDGLTRYEAVFN